MKHPYDLSTVQLQAVTRQARLITGKMARDYGRHPSEPGRSMTNREIIDFMVERFGVASLIRATEAAGLPPVFWKGATFDTAATADASNEPATASEPTSEPATEPAPVPAPAPAPAAPGSLDAIIDGRIDARIAATPQPLDETCIRVIVAEELARQPARVNEVRITLPNGVEYSRIEGHTHPLFPKVVKLVSSGVNVLLVGPGGSGKTYMAEQVAAALKKDAFIPVSCNGDSGATEFTGMLMPLGDAGRFEYVETSVPEGVQGNNLVFFDETDAMDENSSLMLNSLLANGYMNIAKRKALRDGSPTLIRKHAGCIVMGSANTFGGGANPVYCGRNQLDGAFLDRWYTVYITYDKTLEEAYAEGAKSDGVADAFDILADIHNIRTVAEVKGYRHIVSTRMLQKALAVRKVGLEWSEIKKDLLGAWTTDQKASIGVY